MQDCCVNTQPEDVNSSKSDGHLLEEASSCNTGCSLELFTPRNIVTFCISD